MNAYGAHRKRLLSCGCANCRLTHWLLDATSWRAAYELVTTPAQLSAHARRGVRLMDSAAAIAAGPLLAFEAAMFDRQLATIRNVVARSKSGCMPGRDNALFMRTSHRRN